MVGDGDAPGAGAFPFPTSFGTLPRAGDVSQKVVIEAEARRGNDTVVSRRVRNGFLDGKSLYLPLFLASACRDADCPGGASCVAFACASDDGEPRSPPAGCVIRCRTTWGGDVTSFCRTMAPWNPRRRASPCEGRRPSGARRAHEPIGSRWRCAFRCQFVLT